MKILQTVFDIMDYGGIVNHVELLAKGFKELGHQTTMVILRNVDRRPYQNKLETHVEGTYTSNVANQANTITGWYGATVFGYGGSGVLSDWWRYASKFDLIIHQLPVPKPAGYWREIYEADTPQIAIVHDAHFRTMYPHMIDIADKLIAVSVTNPAGYVALEHYPGKRCFIGAPHVPEDWDNQRPWKKRPGRFVSAHVWKPWKHMDAVLRALPHLSFAQNVIGGDGIEARYMRSIDKCKPRYKGLWKQALKAGMQYRGLMTSSELMEEYVNARVMVDMSYSKKFELLGNHFNRSTIEAYNGGCVPLVCIENMADETGIFQSGKHYLYVSKNATPLELATAIEETVHTPARIAEDIVANGRKLLMKHFDYIHSAEEFIRLAKGKKDIGIYGELAKGWPTKQTKEARDEILRAHARET